jgi:hypothetical protein
VTTIEPTFVPDDAYMHDPSDHPNFNESQFFHFVDDASEFAMLVRIGNRVNEGHAEVTVLVFQPGGKGAFDFQRVPISDNSAFDAGGLRFEVVEPLRRMRVTYSGQVRAMDSPAELENPKQVFTQRPHVAMSFELDYEVLTPVYGLATLQGAEATASLSAEHYQVPCRTRGRISYDGESREVTGHGFHDHSWGPRQWQRPQWWRWVSGIADDRNWFEGFTWKIDDTRRPDFGRICRDGVVSAVETVDFRTEYDPEAPHYPRSVVMTLGTADGPVEVTGELVHLAPLRHRGKDGEVARISEQIFRCTLDGRTVLGFSEYHDQMVDGRPLGMGEV